MSAKATIAGLTGDTRSAVRTALKELGISAFSYPNSTEELISSVKIGGSDIVVFGVDFEKGKALNAIKSLRLDKLGNDLNPYATVMCTAWANDQAPLQKAISAGVDDLLMFPVALNKLKTRIEKTIHDRKPFIVTNDYVGPERRRDPERVSSIPYFHPPNSLKMQLSGEKVQASDIRDAIEQSRSTMGAERLKREAFQIAFLARVATEDFMDSGPSETVVGHLKRMLKVLDSLEARNKQFEGPDISELAKTLRSTLQQCLDAQFEEAPSIQDVLRMLRLVEPICRGISLLLGLANEEDELIREIGDSVATFRSRQR